MPNQLYSQHRQLTPADMMEAVKSFKGTPEDAKNQALQLKTQLGISDQDFEQLKGQAQQIARSMGLC